MEEQIHQYIRTKRGQKRGVMLAKKEGEKVFIGWSLCKIKVDQFNLDRAFNIAEDRIEKRRSIPVPFSITNELENFSDRAARYFKDNDIIVVGND